ncbi:hypothetical protein ACFL35_11485 [Candidatus Riflebacteria bacterium]
MKVYIFLLFLLVLFQPLLFSDEPEKHSFQAPISMLILKDMEKTLKELNPYWSWDAMLPPYLPDKPHLGKSNYEGSDRGKKFSAIKQRQKINIATRHLRKAKAEFSRLCYLVRKRSQNLRKLIVRLKWSSKFSRLIDRDLDELSWNLKHLSLLVKRKQSLLLSEIAWQNKELAKQIKKESNILVPEQFVPQYRYILDILVFIMNRTARPL